MNDIDPIIYLSINEDLKNTKYSTPDATKFHWKSYGYTEGRPSNVRDLYNDFNPVYYNFMNPDLQRYKLSTINLVRHWITKGRFEGRKYCPDLNTETVFLYTDDINYSRAEAFSHHLNLLGINYKIITSPILNTHSLYILFTHREVQVFPYYYILYLDNYDILENIINNARIILVDILNIPVNLKKYLHKLCLVVSENPEITLIADSSDLVKRALIASDYPDLDLKLELEPKIIYCLTQIEYNYRLNKFRNQRYLPNNIDYINGIKHPVPWIGCSLSYKSIIKNAISQNLPYITICQDDILFTEYFNINYDNIITYLLNNDIWDVFIGLNTYTDPNLKVLNKFKSNSSPLELLQINQISSLAFVIFNKSVFNLIENWETKTRSYPKDLLVNYLNTKKLRILTTNPFLVRLNLDVNSTMALQKKNETTLNKIRVCENLILNKKIFVK